MWSKGKPKARSLSVGFDGLGVGLLRHGRTIARIRVANAAIAALNLPLHPVTWPSSQAESTLKMAITNPFQFLQQVRAEVSKVVWPTRREVLLTTIMVFIMAALTAVFFALVDILIRGGLQAVLGYFG